MKNIVFLLIFCLPLVIQAQHLSSYTTCEYGDFVGEYHPDNFYFSGSEPFETDSVSFSFGTTIFGTLGFGGDFDIPNPLVSYVTIPILHSGDLEFSLDFETSGNFSFEIFHNNQFWVDGGQKDSVLIEDVQSGDFVRIEIINENNDFFNEWYDGPWTGTVYLEVSQWSIETNCTKGCTYESASNYNPEAVIDDNSCVFNEGFVGDLDGDGCVTSGDLTIFLSRFGICGE